MVLEAVVDPNVLSCSVPITMREQGRSLSGKMKPVFGHRMGRGSSLVVGQGGAQSLSLGRDRTHPSGVERGGVYPSALGRGGAGPKASGETEASPLPSGEAGLAQRRRARRRPSLCPQGLLPSGEAVLVQRRRARRNLTFVIRARNTAAPLSVQKFLTFDGYWFHLLGYPGIRSPTQT